MAIITAVTTLTSEPTLLSTGGETDFAPGRSVAVHNPGPGTALLGGPTLTVDDGLPLAAGATFAADLQAGNPLYGLAAAGTQDVHVMQIGV